jgi:hypothetical protein
MYLHVVVLLFFSLPFRKKRQGRWRSGAVKEAKRGRKGAHKNLSGLSMA